MIIICSGATFLKHICAFCGVEGNHESQTMRDCYASLTPREQEVMELVVSGILNKQVGLKLGISEITVKAHRGKMMQKMKAGSIADLVKMAVRPGLATGRNPWHVTRRVEETN